MVSVFASDDTYGGIKCGQGINTKRIFQQQSAGGNSFEKDEDYIRPGEFLKEVLIEDPLHSEKKTTIIPLVEVRPEVCPEPQPGGVPQCNSCRVAVTEAELDVLTGKCQVSRVDILFDCREK
ncbi:hypothetical protein EOD39_15256 [Acipenser ruthenus]|uniref:Uncharacterized protein n=1 Tax=Acipenser ruthenus TaxID=7906 RepID=A0A444UDM6_ACIRT|nr:hypothetical protein EOD39_15256 [Acipenser ruthenus]